MSTSYQWNVIGEVRSAWVHEGILERMDIARDGDGITSGEVVKAQLLHKLGSRGIVRISREEAVLAPLPDGATEGATFFVEVTRSAWLEKGRSRLAKVRPSHLERAALASQKSMAAFARCPDHISLQWEDAFDCASHGKVGFEGGSLLFTPTPALLAVDVDGADQNLLERALVVLARHLLLWNVGGAVVVDLPDASKPERQRAVAAFDQAMGNAAYERTAINGFGLLQIILPRKGRSILERAQLERAGSDSINLLNTVLKCGMTGPVTLVAVADVVRWISSRPHLLEELERRYGYPVSLRLDDRAGCGYVEPTAEQKGLSG